MQILTKQFLVETMKELRPLCMEACDAFLYLIRYSLVILRYSVDTWQLCWSDMKCTYGTSTCPYLSIHREWVANDYACVLTVNSANNEMRMSACETLNIGLYSCHCTFGLGEDDT